MLLQNEYAKILIPFLEARKEGYEKRGLIPTLELLINDMKTMEIKMDPQDAEDVAVDIAVEQEQLANTCGKCGSTLIGEDSELQTQVCSNCL